MTAKQTLVELYQEWRRLTEAEGEAIRQASWTQVDYYQTAKRKLQPQIVTVTEQFQDELPPAGPERAEGEQFFRKQLGELIQLEVQNGSSISSHRAQLEAERAKTDQSRRNLRQLREYYAPNRCANWQSYS